MKTIEELYNIAEHALDGFGEGCYALEYHDVEEDDGVPYEDDGDLLRNPALHRCGCGIDMVVEVEEDDIR